MQRKLACYFHLLAGLMLAETAFAGTTTYVDQAAAGADSGTSWTDAYTNLQSALATAVSDDQVWVAQGTYYPTNDSTRSARFAPGAGVALYGGFTSGMTSTNQRDWNTHLTILDGDIQRDGLATNNAWHVVVATNDVTLDGFTICNGYANGTETYGGGLLIYSNRNVTVQNCLFTSNAAINAGGALAVYSFNNSSSNTVIDNCVFRNNQVTNGSSVGGGGALYVFEHDVRGTWTNVIRRCRFSGNSVNPAATTSGGGAFGTYSQGGTVRWSVSDCFFLSNNAYFGGAVRLYWPAYNHVFSNCVFSANAAYTGGAVYGAVGGGRFLDCIFSDNPGGGSSSGAVEGEGFFGSGCVFCGSQYGVRNFTAGTSCILTNCLVAGNAGARYGGVQATSSARMRIVNCTLAFNGASRAAGGGALTLTTCSNAVLENCILWRNANIAGGPTNVYSATSTATVSYVAIEGGFTATSWSNVNALVNEGAGNINTNPLFPDPLTGTWSAGGVFDAENGQTLLTDGGAAWSLDGLTAQLVKPSGSGYQYYIASNTATTIYMWGNAAVAATNGAPYTIYDYHLQSRQGRWTAIGWTNDAVTSPCIDAGNPASDYALEPFYNGRRINMGVFGNTDEASKSFLAGGTIILAY